jgi:hypothetical protein
LVGVCLCLYRSFGWWCTGYDEASSRVVCTLTSLWHKVCFLSALDMTRFLLVVSLTYPMYGCVVNGGLSTDLEELEMERECVSFVREIGRGEFGTVWEACLASHRLGINTVAVKMLNTSSTPSSSAHSHTFTTAQTNFIKEAVSVVEILTEK